MERYAVDTAPRYSYFSNIAQTVKELARSVQCRFDGAHVALQDARTSVWEEGDEPADEAPSLARCRRTVDVAENRAFSDYNSEDLETAIRDASRYLAILADEIADAKRKQANSRREA